LPSGSRNRIGRLPQGIVVGSCTQSLTSDLSRSYSRSTSSTRKLDDDGVVVGGARGIGSEQRRRLGPSSAAMMVEGS
jgi:hypothetical protein